MLYIAQQTRDMSSAPYGVRRGRNSEKYRRDVAIWWQFTTDTRALTPDSNVAGDPEGVMKLMSSKRQAPLYCSWYEPHDSQSRSHDKGFVEYTHPLFIDVKEEGEGYKRHIDAKETGRRVLVSVRMHPKGILLSDDRASSKVIEELGGEPLGGRTQVLPSGIVVERCGHSWLLSQDPIRAIRMQRRKAARETHVKKKTHVPCLGELLGGTLHILDDYAWDNALQNIVGNSYDKMQSWTYRLSNMGEGIVLLWGLGVRLRKVKKMRQLCRKNIILLAEKRRESAVKRGLDTSFLSWLDREYKLAIIHRRQKDAKAVKQEKKHEGQRSAGSSGTADEQQLGINTPGEHAGSAETSVGQCSPRQGDTGDQSRTDKTDLGHAEGPAGSDSCERAA